MDMHVLHTLAATLEHPQDAAAWLHDAARFVRETRYGNTRGFAALLRDVSGWTGDHAAAVALADIADAVERAAPWVRDLPDEQREAIAAALEYCAAAAQSRVPAAAIDDIGPEIAVVTA